MKRKQAFQAKKASYVKQAIREKSLSFFVFLLIMSMLLSACTPSSAGKDRLLNKSEAALLQMGGMENREDPYLLGLLGDQRSWGEEAETLEMTETAEEDKAQETVYTFSFAGDCTLADMDSVFGRSHQFTNTVGDDFGWVFRNVQPYFATDDLTFVNLEGVLGLEGWPFDGLFHFHGDEKYVNCLVEGSVEMVTLANNHTYDYGESGYNQCTAILDAAGIPYVESRQAILHTLYEGTDQELTIGFYAADWPHTDQVEAAMELLKEHDPDLIICAYHWGGEGMYYPDSAQQHIAHLSIDLGADIVYGSHAHVLQPVEEYEDGIIYYGMGNFAFGGNDHPIDYDSVVIQQQVVKEADGEVRLGETILIPCSVSSDTKINNFQPTPYEEGSAEYERVLTKLNGTYDGGTMSFSYY